MIEGKRVPVQVGRLVRVVWIALSVKYLWMYENVQEVGAGAGDVEA